MGFLGEVLGFLGALLDVMGLQIALLAGFVGAVLIFTRRRPGRRGEPRYPHPSAYDDYAGGGGDGA